MVEFDPNGGVLTGDPSAPLVKTRAFGMTPERQNGKIFKLHQYRRSLEVENLGLRC
jgi:hypothetical protein